LNPEFLVWLQVDYPLFEMLETKIFFNFRGFLGFFFFFFFFGGEYLPTSWGMRLTLNSFVSYTSYIHSLKVITYIILVCLCFDCSLSHDVRCGIFHLWHTFGAPKVDFELGLVVHTCNSSIQETDVGG
jgi:hypothetical protein